VDSPRCEAEVTLPVATERDLRALRREVGEACTWAGFSALGRTKLVTASSELGRNVLVHATTRGEARVRRLVLDARRGVEVQVRDAGPGIADPDRALRDGYSTVGSMGVGLPGARRLVDEFDLASDARHGTRVKLVSWS